MGTYKLAWDEFAPGIWNDEVEFWKVVLRRNQCCPACSCFADFKPPPHAFTMNYMTIG